MKIKALKPICGPTVHIMAGQEAEVSDEFGKVLVDDGAAVAIDVPKAAEAEGGEPEAKIAPEKKLTAAEKKAAKAAEKKAAEAEGGDKE